MAAWQATFELHPISNSPSSYRSHLDEHVPRISSWRPELEWWGAEDGNRIDVWSKEGRPSQVVLQLDMREPDEAFTIGITRFAAQCDLRFRGENGAEVLARLEDISAALEGSRVSRFVEDPERYFRRLRAAGIEDA